jgi:Signal transduction histidine kinase
VNQLVCSVRDEYAYNAKTKGLELTLDPLCPETEIFINNDGVKLKQVLINLIGNAIKFSKDGAVEIGFRTKKDSIQFHVKDNGIGIPKDYQKKVFERFIQVESDYTREYGGNGLGLAISKSFVELWGGNIWVESEVDKGSTFCFTIPKK